MRQISYNPIGFLVVFVLTLGAWSSAVADEQLARLEPPVGAKWFGFSSATDGQYVVVGDIQFDYTISQTGGAAIVYRRDGGGWVQDSVLVPDTSFPELQLYGYSLAIDQGIIVVGAYYDMSVCDPVGDCGMGSAHVFRRDAGGWVLEARLFPSGIIEGTRYGSFVSLSDGRAVVSAGADRDGESDLRGATYVFRREGTNWIEEARLTPSDVSDGSTTSFRESAQAIDGQRLLIGATTSEGGNGAAGAAYVFRRVGTTWSEEARLMPPEEAGLDNVGRYSFARFVDLSGDLAVASGFYSEAYVYRRSASGWSFDGTLSNLDLAPNDEAPNDGHLTHVKTDGHNVLVTTVGSNFSGPDASTMAIYQRENAGWTRVAVLEPTDDLVIATSGDPTAMGGGLVTIGAGLLGQTVSPQGNYDSSSSSVYVFRSPAEAPSAGSDVPALTSWGVFIMALMLTTAATWIVRRRVAVPQNLRT